MDPGNDHIVKIQVADVRVAFAGFVVTTDNLISMSWDDKTVYEAIHSIATAVGGELEFDPVAKTVYHHDARGQNLTTNNVVEFRRGSNIVKMPKRKSTGPKVVNRLICCGYGEGEYMIRCIVDATDVNDDGDTSQDVYGVKWGLYENKECKRLATLQQEGQTAVAQSQWPQKSYTPEVTDASAALCEPGDIGHFVYRGINEYLRILEIHRSANQGPARLVVARRSEDVADYIVSTERTLATLQGSYQGVPSDSNMYFSEIFDRFADVDIAAEIPFFMPYGSYLRKLWLTYEVGGMRATTKGAEAKSAGASSKATSDASSKSTSDSPSTDTSGASSKSTSDSPSTDTSGASSTTTAGSATPDSSMQDVQVLPGGARDWASVANGAMGTVAVAFGSTAGTSRYAYLSVFNFSGAERSFDWAYSTSYTSSPTWITGDMTLSHAGSAWVRVSASASSTVYFYVRPAGGDTSKAYSWSSSCHGVLYSSHGHGSHDHNMEHTHSLGAHSHGMEHTHGMEHDHGTHTHDLEYGIHESAAPTTLRVSVDDNAIADLNDVMDLTYMDLTPYVRKDGNGMIAEGRHTLKFTTPTNGKTGSVRGTLYIEKFLAVEAG
jgi:hypothetical protein